jgi:hypothetical protein
MFFVTSGLIEQLLLQLLLDHSSPGWRNVRGEM